MTFTVLPDAQARPHALFKSLLIYRGLNEFEKDLVVKKPRAAFIVYLQKERAERASRFFFPAQVENDEGDAFRHFVWAGLLTHSLGPKLARRFLDAHEARPGQPVEEERMDRFNNGRGQRAALALMVGRAWSRRALAWLGLEELRRRSLVVLRPHLPVPSFALRRK